MTQRKIYLRRRAEKVEPQRASSKQYVSRANGGTTRGVLQGPLIKGATKEGEKKKKEPLMEAKFHRALASQRANWRKGIRKSEAGNYADCRLESISRWAADGHTLEPTWVHSRGTVAQDQLPISAPPGRFVAGNFVSLGGLVGIGVLGKESSDSGRNYGIKKDEKLMKLER